MISLKSYLTVIISYFIVTLILSLFTGKFDVQAQVIFLINNFLFKKKKWYLLIGAF